MGQSPARQSSWRRGREDTDRDIHTRRFWVVELILSPSIAILVGAAVPTGELWLRLLTGGGAGLVTIVGLMAGWFAFNVARAPYRQLDEVYVSLQPSTRNQPLGIPRSSPNESGGIRFERLCVHNPNDHAVPECYGRLVESQIADVRPDAYRGPPEGYHYPWSTHGGNATHTAIGAHSDDYLDLFFAVGPEGKKCYTPRLNQLTGKIEQAHSVLVGQHRLVIEVGSKAYDIPPQRFEVIVLFKGGLDLSILSIEPIPDTEDSLPQ